MSDESGGPASGEGFLIGALTTIVFDAVQQHVQAGYAEAGFGDLTPAHSVVFRLMQPDGDRVVDLARRARMTKQAMGYLVRQLEDNGYVERIPHPHDGRAQIVRRTARGWAVNRLARRLVQEIQDAWADQIGEAQMAQLIALLRELVDVIGVPYRGSVSDIGNRAEGS